jgi:hypothetical protein
MKFNLRKLVEEDEAPTTGQQQQGTSKVEVGSEAVDTAPQEQQEQPGQQQQQQEQQQEQQPDDK